MDTDMEKAEKEKADPRSQIPKTLSSQDWASDSIARSSGFGIGYGKQEAVGLGFRILDCL